MSNLFTGLHAELIVAVVSLVTIAIRFLPFIVFKGKTPKALAYLGKVLPAAIMAMLVVFCLKETSFSSLAGFLPQLVALAACFAVHKWKHNTLLSIIVSTACYMLLIRM